MLAVCSLEPMGDHGSESDSSVERLSKRLRYDNLYGECQSCLAPWKGSPARILPLTKSRRTTASRAIPRLLLAFECQLEVISIESNISDAVPLVMRWTVPFAEQHSHIAAFLPCRAPVWRNSGRFEPV